jgi:hypothetical protein
VVWLIALRGVAEGYVSLQQFKRILSAILPMAEFSGKKEVRAPVAAVAFVVDPNRALTNINRGCNACVQLDRITAAAESLVRKGFVPYTLFKGALRLCAV